MGNGVWKTVEDEVPLEQLMVTPAGDCDRNIHYCTSITVQL